MTKSEQLIFDYLRAQQETKFRRLIASNDMGLGQIIKKAVEENEKKKLSECVDIISTYCKGQKTCLHCMFFEENGHTLCKLKNATSAASWSDKIER